MAFVSRLIVLFVFFVSSVFAAGDYSDGNVGVRATFLGVTYYGSTDDGVCLQLVPAFAAHNGRPVIFVRFSGGVCYYSNPDGSLPFTQNLQYLVCPQGEKVNFSSWRCVEAPAPPECSENQELNPETNTCVCKTGPAGAFAVSGDVYTGCNDGCTIVLTSGSYSATTNKTYGNWNQNGNTCSPSPELPGVDSPDSPDGQDAGKCPTGQCPGTFNGQFMCVPCKGKESSDSSSSENTTETPNGASAPSGSASQSQTGSKSTECDAGVCTTKETVVTRNPDGSTTEQQKEMTESISDYCAKNPKAAICKAEDAGQWGGACAGGFQCKGDAVQCAQAQAAWKAACLLDVAADDPNVVKGGQAMSSDQSALRAQLGLDDTGENFNLSSMIDSDPLFAAGGGCPADQQVTLLGQSLTLSLSAWCSWLQTAGTILQAAAYLAAALIVFRRG